MKENRQLLLAIVPIIIMVSSVPAAVNAQDASSPPTATTTGIEILNHINYRDDPDFVTVAEVLNNSTLPVSVEITAQYFNSDRVYVASASAFAELDSIHPGQKAPVKIRLENLLPPAVDYAVLSVSEVREASTRPPMLRIDSNVTYDESPSGQIKITGKINNAGSEVSHSTKVVATFYMAQGSIVDTRTAFVDTNDIPPNETANFEISQNILAYIIEDYSLAVESQEYSNFAEDGDDGVEEGTLPVSFDLSSQPLDGITYTVQGRAAQPVSLTFLINPNESVQFDFNGGAGGDMELTLPKAVIDGIHTIRIGDDDTVQFEEVSSNSVATTIRFTLPEETDSIVIEGATVVPEFPTTVLVMTSAIGSVVAVLLVSRSRFSLSLFRL